MGLLVLFLMPAILVVVISLVQENVAKTFFETRESIILVDEDHGDVGQSIERDLAGSGIVGVVTTLDGRTADKRSALDAVGCGRYQVCILIPRGLTAALQKKAREAVETTLSWKRDGKGGGVVVPEISVYFDPAVQGSFRGAVLGSLGRITLAVETREEDRALAEVIPQIIRESVERSMGPEIAGAVVRSLPNLNPGLGGVPAIRVRHQVVMSGGMTSPPTSVQQNVPAWALFGMFFIVVPLSESLITERRNGTLMRLLTMPVSTLALVTGKVTAYALVCMAQFTLILLIGKLLLPMLGTPRLDLGSDPLAVFLVALSASLAATGFGLLVGTVARSFEQASMFGSVSVVVAAALGGIMVPAYAMPATMRQISVFSPLAWGLNAFLAIFVRGQGLRGALPGILLLLSFFLMSMLLSGYVLLRRGPSGA